VAGVERACKISNGVARSNRLGTTALTHINRNTEVRGGLETQTRFHRKIPKSVRPSIYLFIFITACSQGRVAGATAVRRLEKPDGFQLFLMVLLTPHEDGTKPMSEM